MKQLMLLTASLGLILLLAACALGDTSTPTPVPPLTFAGDCAYTPDLEIWLQVTTQLANDFLTQLNTSDMNDRSAARETVIRLAEMRTAAHQIQTPDCASDVQITLSDAMNRAVVAFQAFANGENTSLDSAVAQARGQIEQVIAQQNDLIARLESQLTGTPVIPGS
jgi:hypothetical protein